MSRIIYPTDRHRQIGKHIINTEKGAALLISMMVLIVLSFIGIYAMRTSNTEIDIAGSNRAYQESFNESDSGIGVTQSVLVTLKQKQAGGQVDKRRAESNVLGGRVDILSSCTPSGTSKNEEDMDVLAEGASFSVRPILDPILDDSGFCVNVQYVSKGLLEGGGVEFASGAEGEGSKLGMGYVYDLDSFGRPPDHPQVEVNVGALTRVIIREESGL